MVALAAQAAAPRPSTCRPCSSPWPPSPNGPAWETSPLEQALEEGWKQGVAHAMSDNIISRQEEEEQLRAFRDSLEVWPESHWPGFALRQTDIL